MQRHSVTFALGSARIFFTAILEKYFSCQKDMWIAASGYYMYFHLIMLFPLAILLQSMNITAS